MSVFHKLTGTAVALALVAGSATPAFARSNRGWGGNWGNGHHRHHNRISGGDIVAGAVVIGVIAAIASAGSKAKREREAADTRYPDDRYPADRYPADLDDRRAGAISSESEAVDACAMAAEQRAGQAASVRDIARVGKSADGWDVEGVIEQRNGWRDRSADRRDFTCSVRFGEVDSVYIEDGVRGTR